MLYTFSCLLVLIGIIFFAIYKMSHEETIDRLQSELEASRAFIQQMSQARVDSYRIPKIPKFFADDPGLWFLKVESSFRSARITSQKTRADIVMAELDAEILLCVRDLMSIDPQPDDLYERIKERIISSYAVSSESRLRQLLKGEVLTDGKPSHILNRLRSLSDAKCSEEILKAIFLDQLPSNHRAILTLSNVATLQELAVLADKITEASQTNIPSVSAVVSKPVREEDLNSRLDRVIEELAKLSKSQNSDNARRSRNQSRTFKGDSKFRRASKKRNDTGLCWYHEKFAEKANDCNEPCSWNKQKSGNRTPSST